MSASPRVAAAVAALALAACRGPSPLRIAVVGDTQRTSLAEQLIGRERNEIATRRLLAAIPAVRPTLLVHLGDMVFDGGDEGDWRWFDAAAAPVRRAGIPIEPVLGNHEYWRGESGLAPLRERFPRRFEHRFATHRLGPLLLVLLDSNRSALGTERWTAQRAWFRATLAGADADPAVSAVLVMLHHPPFTNSTVTGDERDVQEAFVPAFGAARKTLLMISGHAHAYEHFVIGGKHYLVSGGGGGPRVKLLADGRCRHHDLFGGDSPRPFHFLSITAQHAGVAVEVRGFDKGRPLRTVDSFFVPFARPGAGTESPNR